MSKVSDFFIETTEKVIKILKLDDSTETFEQVEEWILDNVTNLNCDNPELLAAAYKKENKC